MKQSWILLLGLVIGTLLGLVGGGPIMLLPWAIGGLMMGWLSDSRQKVLLNGAVYGFVLSFVFLVQSYDGTDPVSSKLVFFALLGLFGALCGLVLALIGRFVPRIKREGGSNV